MRGAFTSGGVSFAQQGTAAGTPATRSGTNSCRGLSARAPLRQVRVNFALVGNEDIEEVCLVRPQILVTRVPRDEMGRQAAAALVRRIENPDAPPQRIVLKTELVIRDTCCTCPPAT